MKTWKPAALIVLTVLMTTGCVKLWQENLDIRTYLLQVERSAPALESPLAGKLWIEPVRVLPPYNSRNLIVRESDVEFSASYYTELLMAPSDNFSGCFFTWFADSGIFDEVSVFDRIGMTHSLSVSVLEFYVDEPGRQAVLKVKVTLMDEAARENRLLLSRNYLQAVAVEDTAVDRLVRAYNAALAEILSASEKDIIDALQK